jgi:hypothetical protein
MHFSPPSHHFIPNCIRHNITSTFIIALQITDLFSRQRGCPTWKRKKVIVAQRNVKSGHLLVEIKAVIFVFNNVEKREPGNKTVIKLSPFNYWYNSLMCKTASTSWFSLPFLQKDVYSPAGFVPPPSHLTSCTPTKSNLYFDSSFDTLTYEPTYIPCAKSHINIPSLRSFIQRICPCLMLIESFRNRLIFYSERMLATASVV